MPADLSHHAHTLIEEYHIANECTPAALTRLLSAGGNGAGRIPPTEYPGLTLAGIFSHKPAASSVAEGAGEGGSPRFSEGDIIAVQGPGESVAALALDAHLAIRPDDESTAEGLFNRASGLAEVIVRLVCCLQG